MLPDKVRYVFLSATIPNASEFALWIAKLHKQVGLFHHFGICVCVCVRMCARVCVRVCVCVLWSPLTPLLPLRVHLLAVVFPLSALRPRSQAVQCGVHRLPAHSPPALHLPIGRRRALPRYGRQGQLQGIYRALHCTALLCAALHYTALHCSAHCSALHCTALHYTALLCTALHCTVLHCTALYCTVLHSTGLHCTVLHCTACRVASPPFSGHSTSSG